MTITVLWYNARLGYGFGTFPGIPLDILIHKTSLKPSVGCLQRGDRITCDLIPPGPEKLNSIRRYGPRAVNVSLPTSQRSWIDIIRDVLPL